MKKILTLLTVLLFIYLQANAQSISGIVTDSATADPLPWCAVRVMNSDAGVYSAADGTFTLSLPAGNNHALIVNRIGYRADTVAVIAGQTNYRIALRHADHSLNTVVVTGTMKPVSRAESPVAIDVITPDLFSRSAAVCLLDAASMLNGVQPQTGCNVCYATELRINGLSGPYTLVLIDGMPIVSTLSSVYGLNGIPVTLIERVEVVKGPASSLYGSEAMGGIINIITRDPHTAPKFSIDVSGTSWEEYSADAGVSYKAGRMHGLLGINAFNFTRLHDTNNDGFRDVPLQQRISVFNKYTFDLKNDKQASLAARVVYEDRNGGEMNWTKEFRGTDSIYGESIQTKRAELLGMWQLPLREKITFQFSSNIHIQESAYGTTIYDAEQFTNFAQLFWQKEVNKHSLLAGAAFRHTRYNDNTAGGTNITGDSIRPVNTPLPGLFVQDEWKLSAKHSLLAGWRSDYDQQHGFIHSPRVAYRWDLKAHTTLRVAAGTGFRVVNILTEEISALSGSRYIVINEPLNPERSVNGSVNIYQKFFSEHMAVTLDGSAFYTHFTHKIFTDFDSNPDEIRYLNLNGNAASRGAALNAEVEFSFPLLLMAGVTWLDVFVEMKDSSGKLNRIEQLRAPKWSGTFTATYSFPQKWSLDVNGRWQGGMRLPIFSNDFRPEYSPAYCLMNVQLRKEYKNLQFYAGVRNLLNFLPQDPIMRPFDPFDRTVNDPVNNPNGYTFDSFYTYAPVQGVRGFAGVRWIIR
jgi:outer membrane receptor for ferrienterochelin and colicins